MIDGEAGRWGDEENGRRRRRFLPHFPHLPISPSPHLPVSMSPCRHRRLKIRMGRLKKIRKKRYEEKLKLS
jgi:hypothetical protein